MFKYEPSKYVLNRVFEFAAKRVKGSRELYTRRGEKNLSKMEEDIVIGTLGEYAVQNYCKEMGYKCSRPDLKIYEKRRKSYDADLTCVVEFGHKDVVRKLHVKSQSTKSVKKYGLSWLFQRSDGLVKSPELEDLMVFTNVDPKTWECEVVGFVNPTVVCKLGLWGECKVWQYQKTKVAIYLEDLEPYGLVEDGIFSKLKKQKIRSK